MYPVEGIIYMDVLCSFDDMHSFTMVTHVKVAKLGSGVKIYFTLRHEGFKK